MAKKKKLLTVKEYAATRTGWRGQSVSPAYVYELIKKVIAGKKTVEQVGFKFHAEGKGYKIEPLKTKSIKV